MNEKDQKGHVQPKLMRQINSIARCSMLYRDFQLRDTDISGYQSPYLPEIQRNPGQTQEELAQKLHVNRSTVTRHLTTLEQSGYITRTRSETDKRILQVYPTAKLTAMLPMLRHIFRNFRLGAAQALTAEEEALLGRLLDKLALGAEELVSREVLE